MLDYTNIQQQIRTNSCLKSYHNHLQQKIKYKPTWFDLVEGLKKEEFDIFYRQVEKERRRIIYFFCKLLKKFTPEYAKKKLLQQMSPISEKEISKKSKSLNNKSKLGKTKKGDFERLSTKKIKTPKAENSQNSEIFESFQNSQNSCRDDSFLAFYFYSIYNSYDPSFDFSQSLPPQEVIYLYITCDLIIENQDFVNPRDNFWKVLNYRNIDTTPYEEEGLVTDLFRVFNNVQEFKMIYSETRYCKKCKHYEHISEKCINPYITIPKQFRTKSFHKSYLNLSKSIQFTCPKCKLDSYFITKKIIKESKYLVLLDDDLLTNFIQARPLTLAASFKNKSTGNNYSFISSINLPSNHHFNTLLRNPFLQYNIQETRYYLQDEVINNGRINQVTLREVSSVRAYIAIYKMDE